MTLLARKRLRRRSRTTVAGFSLALLTGLLAASLTACGSLTATSTTTTTSTSTTTTVPTTTTIPKLDAEGLLALARHSVVRVRNTGCGELSVGSAWLADDGRMVSNRHVVEGVRQLEINSWDGRDLQPDGADIADAADISRIGGAWPPEARLTPLKIRTTRVEPGERIAIVGYPEGNELHVATGVAVGYATDPDLAPREILKLTTVVQPGNSGGPAMDEHGEVVGVVYAKELATDQSLVIPIADVFGPTAAGLHPEPGCS